MADSKPIGLGLVGCGAFGLFCLDTFSKMDDIRVAAVADVRKDVAKAFGKDFGVPSYGDPNELIASDAVDLVHIATPPSSHYELVLAAAKAGKHVLCEKPLAMNVRQADEMLAVVESAGTICPVNFVLRYNAVTEAVKAVIDSGVLGRPLSARLTNCAADSNLGPEHWFWDRAVSGGIFIEHGVHFFDLYTHWFGPGTVIDAHTETRDDTDQQDRVMCTIRHDSGAVAAHYHGFDQLAMMDRTAHRIVFETGDVRVEGWIPLTATIDAAVDEDGLEALRGCCRDAELTVLDIYDAEHQTLTGRGRERKVTRRIRLAYYPNEDKQVVYSDSVRDLLADQLAHIRDGARGRCVGEPNGREALALAQAAVDLSA